MFPIVKKDKNFEVQLGFASIQSFFGPILIKNNHYA